MCPLQSATLLRLCVFLIICDTWRRLIAFSAAIFSPNFFYPDFLFFIFFFNYITDADAFFLLFFFFTRNYEI